MEYLYPAKQLLIFGGIALTLGQAASILLSSSKVGQLASNSLKGFKEANKCFGNDGLRLSENIQFNSKYDFEGVGIFGSTGSGKTTQYFYPNLLSDDIEGSIIVTDPKGELFKDTAAYQRDICGRKVYRLDFSNINATDKYNLLENCKDTSEVLQIASSLLLNGSLAVELQSGKKAGGVEWLQMAEPLLAAALLYAKTLKYPYNNVEFAFQLLLTLDTDKLKILFENSGNIDVMTQFNIFSQVGGADRTEGSIKITLAANMKAFTDKAINCINSKTTFNIEAFRKEKSILYISYPEHKSSYFSPYIAPFFNSVLDKLLTNYNNNSLPVHMMFDEFANIGMINNLSIILATCRSRRISFMLCLQSLSQLSQIYGQFNTKSIINNLRTKVLLPGCSDLDTINFFSSICGNIEIKTQSSSKNGNTQTVSTSQSKRKMFEDGELRTLNDGKALIVMSNKNPILDDTEAHYKCEKYLKNIFDYKVSIKEDRLNITNINKYLRDLNIELAAQQEQEDGLEFGKGLFR